MQKFSRFIVPVNQWFERHQETCYNLSTIGVSPCDIVELVLLAINRVHDPILKARDVAVTPEAAIDQELGFLHFEDHFVDHSPFAMEYHVEDFRRFALSIYFYIASLLDSYLMTDTKEEQQLVLDQWVGPDLIIGIIKR